MRCLGCLGLSKPFPFPPLVRTPSRGCHRAGCLHRHGLTCLRGFPYECILPHAYTISCRHSHFASLHCTNMQGTCRISDRFPALVVPKQRLTCLLLALGTQWKPASKDTARVFTICKPDSDVRLLRAPMHPLRTRSCCRPALCVAPSKIRVTHTGMDLRPAKPPVYGLWHYMALA